MKLVTVLVGLSVLVLTETHAAQYVFPENGQSAQQQGQDEYYCHNWSTQQTGYDPTAVAQQAPTQPSQAKARSGSGLRGAIKGAGRGWIVGEVVDGDSGKSAAIGAALGGVRGRNDSGAEQQQNQQMSNAQESKQADYFRARAACLEAKGYSVK